MNPKVYNKHNRNVPADAVYIGRGSPYGNPFVIGTHGDRDEVCYRFEREILPTLNIEPLRGKSLVCFCAPKRCHGDAILATLKTEAGPVEGEKETARLWTSAVESGDT
ncbi:DUF4326 domain-containing protein [Pararhizobium sp.]|uniref:DUF4326 domain-containing protein n=1 Tax=Pararhizobium sp. TaxID=1977563 RepID=UPI0027177C72|nr:DUF4326 domain-containing protein [Pararhizobium sp.]MDO9416977.1 DUF4326 domain-containing protein [Pararhizobium sp.]